MVSSLFFVTELSSSSSSTSGGLLSTEELVPPFRPAFQAGDLGLKRLLPLVGPPPQVRELEVVFQQWVQEPALVLLEQVRGPVVEQVPAVAGLEHEQAAV